MNLYAIAPVAYIEHHKGGDNLVWDVQKGSPPCSPLYDAAALAQVRDEALEEGAKMLDIEAEDGNTCAEHFAAILRAMKGTT